MSNETRTISKPQIVDPIVATFATMDDISGSLFDLIDLTKNNQQSISASLNGLIKLTLKNQKILSGILKKQDANQNLLNKILEQTTISADQLIQEADQGHRYPVKDSVSSTDFFIIDTQKIPGHMVKSVVVNNDGENSIYVGVNVALSSVGPDIIDTVKNDSEFVLLKEGEHFNSSNNRKVIKNIYLLSAKDISYFRATLTW